MRTILVALVIVAVLAVSIEASGSRPPKQLRPKPSQTKTPPPKPNKNNKPQQKPPQLPVKLPTAPAGLPIDPAKFCPSDTSARPDVSPIVGTREHNQKQAEKKKNFNAQPGPPPAPTKGVNHFRGGVGQTLFWDKDDATWRHKSGFDPMTAADRTGLKVKGDIVDMCKVDPTVCKGSKPAFCAVNKKLCCSGKGCPGKSASVIKGMPRSRMPQISEKPSGDVGMATWLSWMDGEIKKRNPKAKKFECPEKNVKVADYSPSQDEIELGKSLGVACGIHAGKLPSASVVCNDKYIYDGHHRWSAFVAYNKWMGGKKPTMAVKECNAPCNVMIEIAQSLYRPPPQGSSNPNVLTFAVLVQMKELYGPDAHEVEEDARDLYTQHTLERMSAAGMEPRGGVSDIHEVWATQYAEKLGW